MRCTYCEIEIPPQEIALGQQAAKCPGCQQVFAMEIEVTPSQPEKLVIVDENGQGYMHWRWFHPVAFICLLSIVVWVAFMILWYNNTIAVPFPRLFPLVHLLVGIVLIYLTLCIFLNSTQVVLDEEYVMVRAGPLPIRPIRRYARKEVRGFESKARLGKGYRPIGYQLFIVLGNNNRKDFIGMLQDDPVLVRFVQRQLERWLGLPAGNCVA